MRSRLRTLAFVAGVFLLAAACGDSRFSPTSMIAPPDAANVAPRTLKTQRQTVRGSKTLPAALRIAAFKQQQIAPGHDFVVGATGALESHMGAWSTSAAIQATASGVHVSSLGSSAAGNTSLDLWTVSIGRPGAPTSTHVLDKHAEGQALVVTRDDAVEERYLAGPLGLEQSYRIENRPSGRGSLVIDVAFSGLAPQSTPGRTDPVTLADASGHSQAGYGHLVVVDSTGEELAAHMEVAGHDVDLVIDDSTATYPLSVDPTVWSVQQELVAPDGADFDGFGTSVAVSGTLAVVGSPFHTVGSATQEGAAYIFVQDGSTWTSQQELTAAGGASFDGFGTSVSIDGTTVIVGSPFHTASGHSEAGAAYVFVQSGTTWTLQQVLVASDAALGDLFGFSSSVSGDTAVIGAYQHDVGSVSSAGAAYGFVRSGTTWAQAKEFTAPDGASADFFGYSVSASGTTTIIGAYQHDVGSNTAAGAAYVYGQAGSTWTLQQELTGSDGAAGDWFGFAVAATSGITVVGAPNHTVGGSAGAGAGYVFVENGSTWSQQQELAAADRAAGDGFGSSVFVSGTNAAFGAPSHGAGAGYLFAQGGTTWTLAQELAPSDGQAGDGFGSAIAMTGDLVVAGSPNHPAAGSSAGSAYVFDNGECDISGVLYPAGTVNPASACQVCNPALSSSAWSSVTNGTACDDGNDCTQTDTCQAGVCTGSNPVTCTASDSCHNAGTCNPSTGVCSNPSASDGTACNDGNGCTQTDVCQAGVCSGINPVTCTASDQCHVAGTCDPSTGACSNPSATDGTTCNDGNACTQTDTCQAGACTGGNPVTCTASDQCHNAGTCNPSTGACSNPSAANGTSCNDGNACTQTDTCQAGACTGGNPVTCTASDQCHATGTCSPSTGACSNPPITNGTTCNDGNACTQTDTCQAGVCFGNNPVACAASDQCHAAGACDPTTGACSNPSANDGTTCNDGNACTQTDACQAGTCSGGNPITCAPSDECHVGGSCDPTSGTCSNPEAPDGTLCSVGTCNAGTCTPAPDAGPEGGTPESGAGTDATSPDAAEDAVSPDAAPDGAVQEAGELDAPVTEAGPEGSLSEAGTLDGSVSLDGEALDGASLDGETLDGLAEMDAKEPEDAGHRKDAGHEEDAGEHKDAGHEEDASNHKDARAPEEDGATDAELATDASDAAPAGGGCSCRVADESRRTDPRLPTLALLPVAAVVLRRRKRQNRDEES